MKSQVNIIALVGMPGAGKSVAADFFRRKGHPVLRFGDETDRGLTELRMPLTEKNERWYREKIRKELGMAAMAIKITPRILEASKTHAVIVLDGLYSWEEYKYLKAKFDHLTLLCIYAAPSIRYARLAARSVRPLTQEEARTRDIAEIENLNKGGPIAIADHLVKNETDIADFEKELEKYYTRLV